MAQTYHIPGKQKCPSRVAYEVQKDTSIMLHLLVKMAQINHIPGKQKCPSRVAYEVQKDTSIMLHKHHVYVSALLLTGVFILS